jgi:hypothetical protein
VWLLGKQRWLQAAFLGVIALQFAFGIHALHSYENYNWERLMAHDMPATMEVLQQEYQIGEYILVADPTLYVYYDAVRYNRTPALVRPIDPGYNTGNAALLATRPELVQSMESIPPGERVWLISPASEETEVPGNWHLLHTERGFQLARLQKFRVAAE